MSEVHDIQPGQFSRMPTHHGDGYCWGGDMIVTFGETSIFIGSPVPPHGKYDANIERLGRLIAASRSLLTACEELVEGGECTCGQRESICAVCLGRNAIAEANGEL